MGNYRNFKLVTYFIAQGTARADKRKLEKDMKFFSRYLKLDKVYLEPFRSGIMATEEQVALCRGILEKHGAPYGVRSEPGEGTTFWFRLPGVQPGK